MVALLVPRLRSAVREILSGDRAVSFSSGDRRRSRPELHRHGLRRTALQVETNRCQRLGPAGVSLQFYALPPLPLDLPAFRRNGEALPRERTDQAVVALGVAGRRHFQTPLIPSRQP